VAVYLETKACELKDLHGLYSLTCPVHLTRSFRVNDNINVISNSKYIPLGGGAEEAYVSGGVCGSSEGKRCV
jgi:hypothetical protein